MIGVRPLAATLATIAVAGSIVIAAVALHRNASPTAGAATVTAPSPSALPWPESIRIPITSYAKSGSGITLTVVDTSTVPAGTIVAQSKAEDEASSQGFAGPGTTVFGSVLANVQGLGSSNPPGLYWVVSIDPPGGAHSHNGVAENFFNVFINATTGKYAAAVSSVEPALPDLPHNAGSSMSPGPGGLTSLAPAPSPTP